MQSFQEKATELIRLGDQFAAEKKYRQAIRQYEQAIRLVPGYAGALHRVIGGYYQALGIFPKAVKAYETVLAEYPDDALIWHELGFCASKFGETDRAVEAFSRVLELQPKDPSAHYHLALAYMQLEDYEDNNEAEKHLKKALKLKPALREQAQDQPLFTELLENLSAPKFWQKWGGFKEALHRIRRKET